jgi:hypothetical protein
VSDSPGKRQGPAKAKASAKKAPAAKQGASAKPKVQAKAASPVRQRKAVTPKTPAKTAAPAKQREAVKAKTPANTRSPAKDESALSGESPLGIIPGSLNAFITFAKSVATSKIADEDRLVHGNQPLVVYLQAALEAISDATLRVRIVGLNPDSKELVTAERKRLEGDGVRSGLQLALFAFEQICDVVYEAMYGPGNIEESRIFFVDAIPEWLETIESWADEEENAQLAESARVAHDAYIPIATRIVRDDAAG